jgi:hypothetical protein
MATRPNIPAKVSNRLTAALKRFQPILSSALARDVNESDTVAIVADLLAELFGYDKYHEVTSEYVIRGTFCDLAVQIEGTLRLLIEVKAIGLDLKEKHLRQAANYAANQGLEWVVLTNGINWRVYKMDFGKAIHEDQVLEFNLLEMNPRDAAALDCLYLLTREGLLKSALPDYYVNKQATNRFILGALVLSDPVVTVIRRELKKISPAVKVDVGQVRELLEREVLKREVAEGDEAEAARKKVQKCLSRPGRKASSIGPGECEQAIDEEVLTDVPSESSDS